MKLVIGHLYVMSARSNVAEKLLPKDVVLFYNKYVHIVTGKDHLI